MLRSVLYKVFQLGLPSTLYSSNLLLNIPRYRRYDNQFKTKLARFIIYFSRNIDFLTIMEQTPLPIILKRQITTCGGRSAPFRPLNALALWMVPRIYSRGQGGMVYVEVAYCLLNDLSTQAWPRNALTRSGQKVGLEATRRNFVYNWSDYGTQKWSRMICWHYGRIMALISNTNNLWLLASSS